MLKVFISYSWKDLKTRNYLVNELKRADYEVLWDEKNIPVGDHIGLGIVKMLEQADVVVALLTPESIKSHFVTEELSRAHHQYTPIYSIVNESIATKLPWFINTTANLVYTEDMELIDCIVKLIKALEEKHGHIVSTRKLHHGIRQQYHHANNLLKRKEFESSESQHLHQLACSTIQNVNDELSSIVKENYTSRVGKGFNFFTKAKPIFENASQIYAVSLDVVSSFWVSHNISDQRLAEDYLKTQPENTVRLFVFSKPDNAHNHVTILNIHAREYGQEGRVFICSLDAYEDLINKFAQAEDASKLEKDFAILEYSNNTGTNTSIYKAILGHNSFTVTKNLDSESLPLNISAFKNVFAKLSILEPGQIDSDYQVMRWEVDLQKKKK